MLSLLLLFVSVPVALMASLRVSLMAEQHRPVALQSSLSKSNTGQLFLLKPVSQKAHFHNVYAGEKNPVLQKTI